MYIVPMPVLRDAFWVQYDTILVPRWASTGIMPCLFISPFSLKKATGSSLSITVFEHCIIVSCQD